MLPASNPVYGINIIASNPTDSPNTFRINLFRLMNPRRCVPEPRASPGKVGEIAEREINFFCSLSLYTDNPCLATEMFNVRGRVK
jgi:hypothetical protein